MKKRKTTPNGTAPEGEPDGSLDALDSLAAEMEQVFLTDLTNAFELTLERWGSRPWYVRASEMILRPLRPLL